MSVITENDVRRMIAQNELKEKSDFYVTDKQIITPSARTYLLEKNINIKLTGNSSDSCVIKKDREDSSVVNKTQIECKVKKESKHKSEATGAYDTLFGVKLTQKPEHMTHLRGNLLVFKDHPRIAFRGAIDSLEADIILLEILAEKEKRNKLITDLEEIILFIRKLLRSELTEEPVGEFILQSLNVEEIREHSYHPSKYYGINHFLPTYKKGEIAAHLNHLRAKTREVELIAYRAFKNEHGQNNREDIVRGLNRLSSLFWIMVFKYLAGQYTEV